MVKSMTGYGRGEAVVHGRSITVELRSVNNRYLDCTIKLPRIYVFAEDAIKSKVQAHISRGKVDVFVTIGPSENGDVSISVNKPVADGYYAALCALRDSYGLKDDISVSLLSRFQDVFLVEKTQEDLEAVSADICSVLELALQDFDAMRAREGEKLFQDVTGRARTIEALTTRVEERAPGIVADYRARLSAKMAEVLQNTRLMRAASSPRPPSMPTRWLWTRRPSACAVTCPNWTTCWPRRDRRPQAGLSDPGVQPGG